MTRQELRLDLGPLRQCPRRGRARDHAGGLEWPSLAPAVVYGRHPGDRGRHRPAVLRYQDLRLSEGPHGKVQWPADTDKTGKTWLTPISPDVRAQLLKILRERPGLGSAPLFPSPRNINTPVSEDACRVWLRKALTVAKLSRLPHDAFHGLRRKWATERKHLPDVDVAKAGGWRSINTMKRSYQQADDAGVIEAVMESRKLRDHGA
jgi:hypothetical protein